MILDPSQHAAIDAAQRPGLTLITGGAGTGKTTIIKTLVDGFGPGNCAVVAFAGKAAARLREATVHSASTIHSRLRYNGHTFLEGHLRGLTVIVDEASMVSADLLAEIVRRRPERLVLVGDAAQLPPVGRGQPFHDLLALRPDLVATLTTCYRNSEAIFKAAAAIREGRAPLPRDKTPGETWSILHTGDAAATHKRIIQVVRDGQLDFAQDVLLVPRNGDDETTPCSVKSLNAEIAAVLRPRDGQRYQPGDRIMILKNYPLADLWNGTTGTVTAVDARGCPWIALDVPTADGETDVLLTPEQTRNTQLAYALTVHKAQGSQFRRVVFAALTRDAYALLDRSLLYTAVTRAREGCCVVGQGAAVSAAIGTVRGKETVLQFAGGVTA
jgi:exodeoxyribonuclease V alpha subunit